MALLEETAAYLSESGVAERMSVGAFAPEPTAAVCLMAVGGRKPSPHSGSVRQRMRVTVRNTSVVQALSTSSLVRSLLHRRGNILSYTRGFCLALGAPSAEGPDRRGVYHVSTDFEWLQPSAED